METYPDLGLISNKMNNLFSYIFLLFVLIPSGLTAQDNDTLETTLPDSTLKGFQSNTASDEKNLYGDNQIEVQKGDNYLYYGQINYGAALKHYKLAYSGNEENARLNFKIGNCYLKTGEKTKSIIYLEKASRLDNRVDADLHLLLGMAFQFNYDFINALREYRVQLADIRKTHRDYTNEQMDSVTSFLNKKIDECNTAMELIKNPARVFIDNLQDSINTEYPEYGPIITADESALIFTSRRPGTTGGMPSEIDYNYYEDIYLSKKENGKWYMAANMGKPVNARTNDAAAGISLDGQKLFVYRDHNGGDLYLSKLKGDKWSKPRNLGNKINTAYHESYASYSYNQKSIFFVSTRKDSSSIGGKDIYQCTLDKKGKCVEVHNLGPAINTPYDETCVFAHPDGKTLYFSSKGHNTMGGYDIFKSTYFNGAWGKAENLGYPINTVDDDVSFSITANNKKGYYSSSKLGGFGGKDIYTISFLGKEKEGIINTEDNLIAEKTNPIKERVIEPEVPLRKTQLTILKGIITDAITLDPLEATVELFDNEKNEAVGSFESNSTTGKYLVSLPSGKNYGLSVKSKGYLFYSENFIIPASADYQVIIKDIGLNKLDVGSKVILKNIFFDTAKDSLRPESFSELARLKKLLDDFPYLRIEISGHTDNVGSENYNQSLSERRAGAVVNYLMGEGVDTARLEYAGYGFNQPIATNDTPEGRQLNRRTEFKITGTDYKPPLKTIMTNKFNFLDKLKALGNESSE